MSGLLWAGLMACRREESPDLEVVSEHDAVTVMVSDNPDNRFSRILTISAPGAAEVQVAHDMGTTPPQPPGEVLVLGLAAGRSHTLTVLADGVVAAAVTVVTDPLPSGWAACDVTGVGGAQEVVCTNGWDGERPSYFCVDRLGEPVWTLSHPDGVSLLAVRSLPEGGFAAVGDSQSLLAIFDARGALRGELTPLDLDGQTRFSHSWIDAHEVIAITEGQWAGAVAVLTLTGDTVEDAQVIAAGVLVVDPSTMEILWDWSAHGALGDGVPAEASMDYSRTGLLADPEDWQHPNALLHRLRPDGGEDFLLSLRGQDWIIAVDVETDAVRWRLGREGDFAGAAEAWFYQQHAPELHQVEGRTRLVLFDNGFVRPEGESGSRVIELELDEEAMTATLVHELDTAFAAVSGDADLLPGGERLQYVVGLGSPPRLVEVSWPMGEELWRLSCPGVGELYRASFFPTIYDRGWWHEVER